MIFWGIYVVVIAVLAIIFHALLRCFGCAVTASTVCAVSLVQIVFYWEIGHLTPFVLLSMVLTTPVAIIVSVLVGLPFYHVRQKHDPPGGEALGFPLDDDRG